MNREELIEDGYKKAKKVIEKMIASHSSTCTERKVKISHKLTLEIKCQRADSSSAYGFEIYAIVKGKAIDCCSDHNSIDEDIKYLIKCYA